MGERAKAFRWAQPGGHVHCYVCRRPLEVGDGVRVAGELAAHAFCPAPKWDDTLEPRPTVLTMDGDTGEDAIGVEISDYDGWGLNTCTALEAISP